MSHNFQADNHNKTVLLKQEYFNNIEGHTINEITVPFSKILILNAPDVVARLTPLKYQHA